MIRNSIMSSLNKKIHLKQTLYSKNVAGLALDLHPLSNDTDLLTILASNNVDHHS